MANVVRFWCTVFLIAVVLLSPACRQGNGASRADSEKPGASSRVLEHPSQVPEDKGDLKLSYRPRSNRAAANTLGSNPAAIERLMTELNQRLVLPFDIQLAFENCGEPDANYDPEIHQITLCDELIDEYHSLFARKIKDKAKLDEAVKAAVASTFLHELGHGLVDAWKIPVTGREEDAVDQLTTLVLIESTEDGEQIAFAGALSFELYAEIEPGAQVYWGEHSLDKQRFFDNICLIYGHDPKKNQYLVQEKMLPNERAEICVEDYERISHAWQQLLAPYLKQPATSRPKLRIR